MPNWCINILKVRGSKEAVKDFDEKFKGLPADYSELHGRDYCFNALYQMPKEIAEDQGSACYDWSIENWGTKWDVYGEVKAVEIPEGYDYHFLTAWSPPISWLEKVARDFPELRFELVYGEPLMGFCGRLVVSGGQVLENYEISSGSSEKFKEFMKNEFDWDGEVIM